MSETESQGHRTLKDILHELINAVDLNADHRTGLHEAVDIHDDPAAQAAKDEQQQAAIDAEAAELQARLDALHARQRPAAPEQTMQEGA